jgi:hypothetical protein
MCSGDGDSRGGVQAVAVDTRLGGVGRKTRGKEALAAHKMALIAGNAL